jgi:hypothetical protein
VRGNEGMGGSIRRKVNRAGFRAHWSITEDAPYLTNQIVGVNCTLFFIRDGISVDQRSINW